MKLVRGDIARITELIDALEGMDGILAIAGFLTLPFSANSSLGLTVKALGHVNVLEAARYRGVMKVIFSSSVAAYGDPEPGLNDETRPFRFHTMTPPGVLYGSTRIIGEQLGKLYSDRHGVQSVSLRYATVYGERRRYRGVNALCIIDTYDKLTAGEWPRIPGDGSEAHDCIHSCGRRRARQSDGDGQRGDGGILQCRHRQGHQSQPSVRDRGRPRRLGPEARLQGQGRRGAGDHLVAAGLLHREDRADAGLDAPGDDRGGHRPTDRLAPFSGPRGR